MGCRFTPQVATAGLGIAGLLTAVMSLLLLTVPDYFSVENDGFSSTIPWDSARATLWELCETSSTYCSSGTSSCEECRNLSPDLFQAGAEHFGTTNTDAFPSMTYTDAIITRITLIPVVALGVLVSLFSLFAFASSSPRRRKSLHLSSTISFAMMLPLLIAAFVAGLKYRVELFDFYTDYGVAFDQTEPWVTTLSVMLFIFAVKAGLLGCAILHGEHGFWPSIKVQVFPPPPGSQQSSQQQQRQSLIGAGAGAGAGAPAAQYAVVQGYPAPGMGPAGPYAQHPAMVVPAGAPSWGPVQQPPAGYYYQPPVVTAAPVPATIPVAAPASDPMAAKRDMGDL